MWEFHLATVELEFVHGSHVVFRQLSSSKSNAVPIMRDFMADSKRAAWAGQWSCASARRGACCLENHL